jgi:hypothetical protein
MQTAAREERCNFMAVVLGIKNGEVDFKRRD